MYDEYLAASTIQAGIKEGKFHQGSFQRSRENYLEGYVQTTAYDEPVLLKGRLACNRSIQG
jgi:exosome complex exonuclease DIS3/RRP44